MRNLLVITAMTLSANLYAANITCASYGSSSYPVSSDAVKLAKHLRVTKCDGKKFTTALRMLKQRIVYVAASAVQIKAIEDARSVKRSKRMAKKMRGFSF